MLTGRYFERCKLIPLGAHAPCKKSQLMSQSTSYKSVDLYICGSVDMWIAGSVNHWMICGSVDRWIYRYVDRWMITGSVDP